MLLKQLSLNVEISDYIQPTDEENPPDILAFIQAHFTPQFYNRFPAVIVEHPIIPRLQYNKDLVCSGKFASFTHIK